MHGLRCLRQALWRLRYCRSYSQGAEPLKVCVVGSGPAGFYTAHQLVKRSPGVCVDVLERLPIPFGLARFGVAPDHPEVKNCINQFTTLAQSQQYRFIGNVSFGQDVRLAQLKPFYHAVVMAYGAEDDRVLGIPGEDLSGVHSARAFVGWYNGLPAHTDLNPDLSGDVAVVLGQGNVALDVARMLLTPVDMLKETDICDHALQALAESKIRRVQLVGRRGPLQVAFTIKELREMTKLPGCWPDLQPEDFDPIRGLLSDLPRPRKRMTELMVKTADDKRPVREGEKEWGLSFLRSPLEIVSSNSDGEAAAVKLEINRLEGEWQSAKAVGTGEIEEMKCSLVLRSIGYKTLPLDEDIPFDPRQGIIPNKGGRVINGNKERIPGLYCSGWVKTGPIGVIVTTMNNAFETAELIVEDFSKGELPQPMETDALQMLSQLPGVSPTSFTDWEKIDREEQRVGEESGKPREKVVSIDRMMEIIRES